MYRTKETNKPTLNSVSALANRKKSKTMAVSLAPNPDTVIGIRLINITNGTNIKIILKGITTLREKKRM